MASPLHDDVLESLEFFIYLCILPARSGNFRISTLPLSFAEVLQKPRSPSSTKFYGSFDKRDEKSLPSVAGLVRACDGLDGARNPWDVDRVHTNTQYLLQELG